MEWLVIGALVLLGALFIKLLVEGGSRKAETKAEHKANSQKIRLEPSARLPSSDTPSVKYRTNKSILSKAEQAFYKALQQGLGDQFLILIKVRVCRCATA